MGKLCRNIGHAHSCKENTLHLGMTLLIESFVVNYVVYSIMSATTEEPLAVALAVEPVEDGKNKFALLCTRCPSKILSPQCGDYVKEEKVNFNRNFESNFRLRIFLY